MCTNLSQLELNLHKEILLGKPPILLKVLKISQYYNEYNALCLVQWKLWNFVNCNVGT